MLNSSGYLHFPAQEELSSCGFASSITTNVLTEPAQPRCSRASIASASTPAPSTSITAWSIAPARSLTRANSPATRTPSSTSNTPPRRRSPGGSITTSRPFSRPQDHQHFLACQQDPVCGARKFFDPNYTSCTSFLAHIASTRFGFDTAPVAELIHWADIVDGAQYESPESAVEMAAPAMKLTLIIESTQDPDFIPRLIPLLTELPLAEVLSQPFVAGLLPPLLERHQQALELIRSRAEERDGTIFFDITDHPLEGFNKFIPYYLYPQATYSIGLSKSSFRTKVAVGSNPWTKADPAKMVNLAQVCERYGGGGHARVGAISFPPDQEEKARAAAAEIVAELRAKNPL